MVFQIINENSGKIFEKKIDNVTVKCFYNIDDDILENFEDEIQNKYNATMDFFGKNDTIGYSIYEIKNEIIFESILNDWICFLQKNITITND